jgi:probable F420-dependent oxidoreductase
MPAPFPALVAAAEATERPRLGIETAGLSFGTPGERVAHLRRTVEELDKLLSAKDFAPQPAQSPRPPLLIGGNGDRVLQLAAQHADIIAFTGAASDRNGVLRMLNAEQLDERVATYRVFAAKHAARTDTAELNILIQMVVPTNDRRATLRPFVEQMRHLTEEQALEVPILLLGTTSQMAEQLRAQRERYGFTYITVLEPWMEAFAGVIEELSGDCTY